LKISFRRLHFSIFLRKGQNTKKFHCGAAGNSGGVLLLFLHLCSAEQPCSDCVDRGLVRYLGPQLRGVPLLLGLFFFSKRKDRVGVRGSSPRLQYHCQPFTVSGGIGFLDRTSCSLGYLPTWTIYEHFVTHCPFRFYIVLRNVLVMYLVVIALFGRLNCSMMISGVYNVLVLYLGVIVLVHCIQDFVHC
jgi:hypothetical protein